MKQIITTAALVVMLLNTSFAATKDVEKPAPEVIKCESTGSCKMTEIEKLPKPKKENKKVDGK